MSNKYDCKLGHGDPEDWEKLVWIGVAASLVWLLRHHYSGIYHDGIIYALLAASWLNPAAYAEDLFFSHGSQGDFSLFVPLYGLLIQQIGLAEAAKLVVMISALAWVGGAMLIARSVFRSSWYFSALCTLLLVWSMYSYSPNGSTFHVIEEFATARSWAQPLALIAVALGIRGAYLPATILAVLATLLHPLMGIWGLVLVTAIHLTDRQLLGSVVIVFALSLLGGMVVDFAALQPMSEEWVAVTKETTRDVFVGPLGVFRLNEHLFWILALHLGARFGSENLRRWYLLCACIFGYAIFLSMLASYYYPVKLIVQTQLWRASWLAFLIGLVALLDATYHLTKAPNIGWRWMVVALAGLGYLFVNYASLFLGCALLITLLIKKSAQGYLCQVKALFYRYRYLTLIILILISAPGYILDIEVQGRANAYSWGNQYPFLKGFLLAGGGGLTLIVVASIVDARLLRRVSLLLIGPLLALVAMNWDQRLPAMKVAEARYLVLGERPFGDFITRGDSVLWPGGEMETWFEIGTTNYAYWVQGIGSVFSNDKRVDLERRMRRIKAAPCVTAVSDKHEHAVLVSGCNKAYGELDLTGFIYLCKDQDLTWVVTERKLEGWRFPEVSLSEKNGKKAQYLYRCSSDLSAAMPVVFY